LIRLYKAEFMVTAKSEGRFASLVEQAGKSEDEVLEDLRRFVTEIRATTGEQENHQALLTLALDCFDVDPEKRIKDARVFQSALNAMHNGSVSYLEAARFSRLVPFHRAANMLDLCLGKKGPTIQRKAQILAVPWGVVDAFETPPSVPARMFIANIYAGESASRSSQEQVGLRMNRGILEQEFDVRLVPRVGPILTQSVSIMSRDTAEMPAQRDRIALAFLASLVVSEARGGQWAARAQRLLPEGETRDPVAVFREWLSGPSSEILKAFGKAPEDVTVRRRLAAALFPEDCHPITKVEELARADAWEQEDWELVQQAIQDGVELVKESEKAR
ncbi:MAG: hypothetical protein AB7D57_09825, partial [Desulfovibrionaceae bacterium]